MLDDRRVGLALLALGALGVVVGGPFARWIGAGLLLFSAPSLLVPAIDTLVARERLARWAPHLLFGAVFIAMFWELLLGRPPATRDHGIHYFQTHLLVHDLLPAGRLNGWSPRLNHGYPYGDSYPTLGYGLMAAAHVVSFGLVSLRSSYALGLAAMWLGSCAAVWWCASSIAAEVFGLTGATPARRESDASDASRTSESELADRPSSWIAWAGCLAALAWLIDPGSARQGGWNYLMFHGVWPQQLSTALWVASLPLTLNLWRQPTPRRIGLLALTVGASVMAHPFGMITCAFSAVAIPAVALVVEGRSGWNPGALRAHLLANSTGAAICAGTVVVFLGAADYMGRSPVPWRAWPDLAAALAMGEPFRAQRAIPGALAVLGTVLAVRRGKAAGWLALVSVVGLMLLASEASVTVLRLDLLVSAFKNLQFPRYSLAVKPVWFALAGVGGAAVLATLSRAGGTLFDGAAARGLTRGAGLLARARQAPAERRFPAWARLVGCIAMAPAVVGAVAGARDAFPHPVGVVHTLEGTHHGLHERGLHQALQTEADAATAPLRVAFLRKHMSGGTYPLFSIADVDAMLAMDSHIPSVNYIYRLDERTPEALDALGTTHVVHDRALPMSDRALESRLEKVGTYGDYTLARVAPSTEDGQTSPAPRFEAPPGVVIVAPYDADERGVAMDAAPALSIEVPAGTRELWLALSPYRKWHATGPDGAPLSIRGRRLFGGAFVGMVVDLDADEAGVSSDTVVELRYGRPSRERNAAWLSLMATLLACTAAVWAHPVRWRPRLRSGPRLRWTLTVGVGLSVLALAVAVPVMQARGLERTWRAHLGKEDGAPVFVRDLVVRGELRTWVEHRDVCDGMLTKDAQAGCSERDQRPHVSMLYARPYLYRCLAVTVPERAEAQLVVDGLAPDEGVYGVIERVTHGAGAKSLTVTTSAPGARRRTMRRDRRLQVRPGEHDGLATIDLRNDLDEAQSVCVALAVARSE